MAHRDIKKIDKTILDNFYKLVHSAEHIRLTAASSTFKILNAMNKNSKPDIFNVNLNYSVDRLVAGLASPRALARRGYGTLLLEVLKSFHVSTERIFTIAQQNFGQVSKETTRDNLLGYLLLISIILESGNYKRSKANQLYLEKVYKCLRQMINIKSYLEYSVSSLFVNHYKLLHSYMLADINPQHFGSDSKASAVDLLLIILCNKKEPIKAAINLDTPVLMNLCYCLLDEKFQKRPLHPVFLEVSQFIIKHYPTNFKRFHLEVLQPTFFKANHNDLASMGLEFMASLIETTEDTEAIKEILSEHLIRLLILSLRNRTSLHVQCNKFFATLKDHFKQMRGGTNEKQENSIIDEKQYTILFRLTSPPGSVTFDDDSKSSSVCDLLHNSSPNVLRRYLNRMIDLLSKQPSKGESQQLEQSCAKQISFIVRRPQMTEDLSTVMKVTRFLLLNSMFRMKDVPSSNVEAVLSNYSLPIPLRTLSESSRQSFKSAYHTTLDHIVSASTSQDRIIQLESLVNFADELFKWLHYVRTDLDEGYDCSFGKLWPNYITSVNEHKEIILKNKVTKQLYPITTLYFFYGLQILEHGLDCSSQLEELSQSAEEVLKGDPADGSWADVITDQIIALLSATECHPWIRKLCESVFGSLLPHISQTSIDLLCDAIKAPHDDAEVDEDNEENDEDDEYEADGTDNEESDEDEDVDSQSEHDSLSGSIDGPDKGDVMSVDEEEEYLNDDQMMKLDTVIADMFKLNRAGKKKNDPAFKLRLLDLVKKIVTKKHNDVETINILLSTIIPLAISSRKMNETKPIAGKITSILTKMPGKSKYPQLNKILH